MHILVLSTWFPFPPDNGSRLRAWHLLRYLARNHDLRLIAGRQDDAPVPLPAEVDSLCSSVIAVPWRWHVPGATGWRGAARALLDPAPRSVYETRHPTLCQAIRDEWARRPDVVLALELGMDPYLPAACDLPVVLDQVELSGLARAVDTAPSARARLRHHLTRTKAQKWFRPRLARYAALTAVSDAEADAVRAFLGDAAPPVLVVPNGVDTQALTPGDPARQVPGRLIYNGALSYGPNREAVAWFVEEILPRVRARVPEAHLVVTGRATSAQAEGIAGRPGVVLAGYVQEIAPALEAARLCVVPLRSGGGTRLKILEAWAVGRPVVATSLGAAGLAGAVDGQHLWLADDPQAFATAVVQLLDDPGRCAQIAAQARELAVARYRWERIGEGLESLLQQVAR